MVCLSTVRSPFDGAVPEVKNSFEVELTIMEFLADPNRASIELPLLLSAEQRKQTKRAVERYPDLKCESFGLGKDRQMHLFKRNIAENCIKEDRAPDCSPNRVSVKNTFIDDWINTEGVTVDERVVQSMPHSMFGQCLSAELSGVAMSGVGCNDVTSLSHMEAASAVNRLADASLNEEQVFAVGAEVVIDGLVKAPSFNGASCVVKSWDAEAGRYNVLLRSAVTNGQQWAKIKSENLQHAQPR